jgi:outer membrane protein assembly factor BamB
MRTSSEPRFSQGRSSGRSIVRSGTARASWESAGFESLSRVGFSFAVRPGAPLISAGDLMADLPPIARSRLAAALLAALSLQGALAVAGPSVAEWPEFRGPKGDGTSSATGLPQAWSESQHVRWKTAIHDRGWSTPVVCGDQLWMTTATEDGRRMYAVAVDRESGKVIQDLELFQVEKPQPLGNSVNCYASPSPVIEPGRVYVHFGTYGTACLDTQTGRTVWARRDLPCNHFRGPGSSPILYRDLLVLTLDGMDEQYLCALQKTTGKTVWRTERSADFGTLSGDIRKAYSTPLLLSVEGEPQMVSCGSQAAYGYEPSSGKEIWKVRYSGFSNASRPVSGPGMVFVNTGFGKADLLAVRLGGKGDVTKSHLAWKCLQGVPLKPSPVVSGGLIFMVNDGGVATCLEAETGAVVWKERIGGEYSASPVLAEGRVYFPSEEGKVTVVEAGRTWKQIASNKLPDGFLASPAIAGKSLFLRTKSHLYRIEN